MKPSNRLKQLVQHLRAGQLVTAQHLSGATSVSLRTVYRDIAALRAAGVQIKGEAGVGYMLRGRP